MNDYNLNDAADMLRQAASVISEANAIRNPALQRAALKAAKSEAERYITAAQQYLAKA